MRRGRATDCLRRVSLSLIYSHIINFELGGEVVTHVRRKCTGTFILATIKTITRATNRTGLGETPGLGHRSVEN
jgi:hypothetical protein